MSSSVGSIPLAPGPSRSPIRRPAPSPDRALPPCGRVIRQPHRGQISSANAARCQAARKRPTRSARRSNLPVTEGSRAPDRLPLDPMTLPAHATPRAAAVLPQSVTAPASRPPHTVVPFPDSAICGPTVRILLSRRRRSSCFGLTSIDHKTRSSSVSTIGPRDTSMSTEMTAGLARVVTNSQVHIPTNPAPPCAQARSPTILPPASIRQTWWTRSPNRCRRTIGHPSLIASGGSRKSCAPFGLDGGAYGGDLESPAAFYSSNAPLPDHLSGIDQPPCGGRTRCATSGSHG